MPQKVALITGGAKRVGRAVAESLAADGYDVAITYRSSGADAREAVAAIAAKGRKAIAIEADLADPQAAAAKIDKEFSAAFSQLDLLVNNASMYVESDLQHVQLTQLRAMWAIHLESPLLLARAFETRLRSAAGCIVNMIDLLAQRPWPKFLGYATTKAALANLTLGIARELAPQVRVNGIAPGVVEWPPNYPESQKTAYLSRVPLARPGSPADVAALIKFLAGPGNYITGQIIPLDGGRSLL